MIFLCKRSYKRAEDLLENIINNELVFSIYRDLGTWGLLKAKRITIDNYDDYVASFYAEYSEDMDDYLVLNPLIVEEEEKVSIEKGIYIVIPISGID